MDTVFAEKTREMSDPVGAVVGMFYEMRHNLGTKNIRYGMPIVSALFDSLTRNVGIVATKKSRLMSGSCVGGFGFIVQTTVQHVLQQSLK